MKLISLNEIFDIRGGHSLDLNKLTISTEKEGIAYVSRKSGDNGISAYVKKISSIRSGKAGELTCALSGNGVLSTFIQERDFYTSYHVAILTPKFELTKMEKFFYCYSILENQYRFNWGRQANKTLKDIQIPSYNDIPKWVYTTKIPNIMKKPLINKGCNLNVETWKYFKLGNIFNIIKGKTPKNQTEGSISLISATNSNNGSSKKINSLNNKNKANTITVSSNGSIAESFYQNKDFFATGDINILECENINVYTALFVNTIISKEKFRFNYGRKWGKEKMLEHKIKLPLINNKPDWEFMENYIKSLDYSASLDNSDNKS